MIFTSRWVVEPPWLFRLLAYSCDPPFMIRHAAVEPFGSSARWHTPVICLFAIFKLSRWSSRSWLFRLLALRLPVHMISLSCAAVSFSALPPVGIILWSACHRLIFAITLRSSSFLLLRLLVLPVVCLFMISLSCCALSPFARLLVLPRSACS
jgi:hypothetical protein